MTDHYEDLPPELHVTARRISAVLRADVPAETGRRHEALLRARLAARAANPIQADGHGAGRGASMIQMTNFVGRPSSQRRSSRRRLRAVAVLAAAAALVLGTGAIAVADEAVPGDVLYGLDRTLERIELIRAGSPAAEADVHLAHADERIREAIDLESHGDTETIVAVASDAVESDNAALQTISSDVASASVESVEVRIESHLARLVALRERLEAEGHAAGQALEALDRVIAKQSAKAGERAQKRADKANRTERPADKGTAPGQDPARQPGRPDDAGPPAGTNPTSTSGSSETPGTTGGGGASSNRSVEPGSGPAVTDPGSGQPDKAGKRQS